MKKWILLSALGLLTLSCGKIKEKLQDITTINKDIKYNETAEIPEAIDNIVIIPPGGISLSMPKFGFPTNSAQLLADFNTTTDLVDDVTIKEVSLKIQAPPSQNFDFVDTIKVYLSSANAPEQLAAYKYGIPKGQNSITLDRTDLNIKDYFLSDSIFYRLHGHYIDKPAKGTQFNLNSVFRLTARLLE